MDIFAYYGIDWAGMLLTITSVYLLGKGEPRWAPAGFAVGFVSALAWITFSILSKNLPLCLVNIVLVYLQAKGFVRWANTNKEAS